MSEPLNADREQTVARLRKELRELQKDQRLERLARGEGKPRTMREMEIWSKGVRERFGISQEDEGDDA